MNYRLGLSIRADIATDNKQNEHEEKARVTETQTPENDVEFQREQVKQDTKVAEDDDYKSRILRAAQQQYYVSSVNNHYVS